LLHISLCAWSAYLREFSAYIQEFSAYVQEHSAYIQECSAYISECSAYIQAWSANLQEGMMPYKNGGFGTYSGDMSFLLADNTTSLPSKSVSTTIGVHDISCHPRVLCQETASLAVA
jgi:hypothetical protein